VHTPFDIDSPNLQAPRLSGQGPGRGKSFVILATGRVILHIEEEFLQNLPKVCPDLKTTQMGWYTGLVRL
jgi:hypothetical protein